jgi:hypothetical protein
MLLMLVGWPLATLPIVKTVLDAYVHSGERVVLVGLDVKVAVKDGVKTCVRSGNR